MEEDSRGQGVQVAEAQREGGAEGTTGEVESLAEETETSRSTNVNANEVPVLSATHSDI